MPRRMGPATRLLRSFVCALLGATLLAAPAAAQDSRADPLTVSFVPIPPFAYYDDNGERAGFLVELAQMIGAELAVPVEFIDVKNSTEFIQAQVTGRTDIVAGVVRLPPLAKTNVFSDSVAQDTLRLTVLQRNADAIAAGPISGKRIGIVPPALGAEERELLARNQTVEFESPEAAVMGLLIENVDALLIPEPVAYSIARKARDDGRIRFVGEPLRRVQRVVAIHQSRADLLEPINAAIARLESDGRLPRLRLRHNVAVPPPPPDTLTVGYSFAPPYKMEGPNGEPTGFAVEALTDLAARADLSIEFKRITDQEWQNGPRAGEFDALTLTNISPERSVKMDITLPILESRLSIFARAGEGAEISGMQDLVGLKVGVVSDHLANDIAQANGALDLVEYVSRSELLEALLGGEIAAALYTSENLLALADAQDAGDQIAEILPPFHVSRVAPGLRFGLGEIRDRLNAVIPGYLVSPEYTALREKYFGEPVFWTRDRVILLVSVLSGLLLLTVFSAGGLSLRTRARQVLEMASVRNELETIFNATSSGIVALNVHGQVERINDRARHFLGGLSQNVPFDWPDVIIFLDSETLTPLDNSADPIRRVGAGHTLIGETHLLRRAGAGDDRRYVRISSSPVKTDQSAIEAVIVIDDISDEEKNRQVAERKSRLDALGQLTGGIAHDFNNVLASLLYSVDLSERAEDPDKRRVHLGRAKASIDRGRSLTTRLLSFARKQPGMATAQSVSKLFDDFFKLVRPMLEATIVLDLVVEEPDLIVYCDQVQLETALMNLVLNSRDAILRAEQGSRIHLHARAATSPRRRSDGEQPDAPDDGKSFRFVEISVSDNGPGMEDEILERATDPFFTTKDSNSGTGLGLAMVYGFVQQSDGDFRIYSETGIGTTINMTLPRGTYQGLREEAVEQESPAKGQGEVILLVEDEAELLMIMTDLLVDLGYAPVTAKSGGEALELIAKGTHFDLLLTDVVMPGGIGGFELARRTRQIYPSMPVVYLSGYTGFTAFEMGDVVATLLHKPARPTELADTIRHALTKT